MTTDAELTAIHPVTQRLSARFPLIPPTLFSQVVLETHDGFADHPTREFVPVLVEETARDRLRVFHTT